MYGKAALAIGEHKLHVQGLLVAHHTALFHQATHTHLGFQRRLTGHHLLGSEKQIDVLAQGIKHQSAGDSQAHQNGDHQDQSLLACRIHCSDSPRESRRCCRARR